MSKITRLDVHRTDDSYEITVDGKSSEPGDVKNIINGLNGYQKELDDMDDTISIIMRELRTSHNLSDDEYSEYEQTLKIILKN